MYHSVYCLQILPGHTNIRKTTPCLARCGWCGTIPARLTTLPEIKVEAYYMCESIFDCGESQKHVALTFRMVLLCFYSIGSTSGITISSFKARYGTDNETKAFEAHIYAASHTICCQLYLTLEHCKHEESRACENVTPCITLACHPR